MYRNIFMAEISREEVAQTLREIALLLELKGENPFKIRAYRNGAEMALSYSGDFIGKARDSQLGTIKGFGAALAQKVHELVDTGTLEYHQNLRSEFPDTLFELFEIQGLGPKKIKLLFDHLGVTSVQELRAVCESGAASELKGFGKKTTDKILEAISFKESNADRFTLGEVMPLVKVLREKLSEHPSVHQCNTAGSVRRGKETVHDIDFIVATDAPGEVIDYFTGLDEIREIMVSGGTKASVRLDNGLQCDLRAVSNTEYPFALSYFTGSKEHNVVMRGRARDRGFTLNEYRLAPLEEGKSASPDIDTEADLYRALDLDYVPASLRENIGEFDAAENGTLPKLIEVENLRGTFHNHTTASDGRSTLEEMVAAAQDLGLGYLGIADHSKAAVQANGLDEKRLLQQVGEIGKLNRSLHRFHVFSGIECDILRDGSMDLDDEALAAVDYVVGSIHGSFTLSEKDQTRRVIRAMENPHVTMIGHLTTRLLLRRDPCAMDIPAIIDAAAQTGTWLELNANSRRLDLDWRWWRMASDKGVFCVINPDAHHADHLQNLYFGVLVARKGWLEKRHVVNCQTLTQIKKSLQRKRKALS